MALETLPLSAFPPVMLAATELDINVCTTKYGCSDWKETQPLTQICHPQLRPETSGSRRPGGPKEFCRPGVASANQDGCTEREKERDMEEEIFLLLIKASVQHTEETTPVTS